MAEPEASRAASEVAALCPGRKGLLSMRRPPLGGSGGRLPVRLGGEESDWLARQDAGAASLYLSAPRGNRRGVTGG
jgi:hypothetical protein